MRIVLGNASLISNQRSGGHWSWFLQYPLGLRALGHDILWLELMRSTGNPDADAQTVRDFFKLIAAYDLEAVCAVMIFDGDLDSQPFESARLTGMSSRQLRDGIGSADLLL